MADFTRATQDAGIARGHYRMAYTSNRRLAYFVVAALAIGVGIWANQWRIHDNLSDEMHTNRRVVALLSEAVEALRQPEPAAAATAPTEPAAPAPPAATATTTAPPTPAPPTTGLVSLRAILSEAERLLGGGL